MVPPGPIGLGAPVRRSRRRVGGLNQALSAGLGLVCGALALAQAGPTQAESGVGFRVMELETTGLQSHNCSVWVELANGLDRDLSGFAAELALLDPAGAVVGRKVLVIRDLRPGGHRIDGVGFKLPVTGRLPEQCGSIGAVGLMPLACQSGADDLFELCRGGLFELPGSQRPILIRRDGQAAPASLNDGGEAKAPRRFRAKTAKSLNIERLGVTLSSISVELARDFAVPDTIEGLLVTAVSAAAPAAESGLKPGDIIAELDQEPVLEPDGAEARLALALDQGRRSLLVLVERAGEELFTVIKIP